MTTITKEWLQQKIADMEAARDEIPFGLDEDDSNTLAALRTALASLEAEPVAYIRDGFRADGVHFCGGIITAEEHERTKPALSDRYNWKHQPLYTSPPAPVMPDAYVRDERGRMMLNGKCEPKIGFGAGFNACRAAMLQGVDGNSPVIPDGWKLVPIVPTEDMVIHGFESEPDPVFSDEKEWEEYEALSGCRQAARRAELCWAAMVNAAPQMENL